MGGSTFVGGSSLIVNGSLANSGVSVGGLGVLGGTGTVGSITVFPGAFDPITGNPVPNSGGGTVAPGHNGIGTLTAVRDVFFFDAGTFQVDVNAAGQSDRLAVGGRAILAGTVQILAAQELYAPQTTYTILTAAGGVTGRFGAVFTNLAFLVPELAYTATDVTLTLRRNDLEFSRAAVTPNQASAGRAAEALGFGNPVFNAILGLRATEARGAFDLLSGEVHASAVTAAVEESRLVRDALLDRLRGLGTPAAGGQAQSAFASYAADAPGPRQAVAVPVQPIDPRVFAVWGQGFGAFGRTDGEAGTAALKRSTGGFILGADATFDERWRAGVAGGYTRTSIDVASRLSSAAIESVHGAVYGGARSRGGPTARRRRHRRTGRDGEPRCRLPRFRRWLTRRLRPDRAPGIRRGGLSIPIGAATVEPFGQLAALRVGTDGFREGGGAAALQSFARTHEVGFSTLGVRAEARLGMDTPFVARGLIGWRRAFGDTTPTALLGFPGGPLPFVIAGAPIARDSLVAEAGLDYRIGQTAALGVSYAGALAQDAQDHTFKGRFEIQF